jgi:hypothetical protein
MPTDGPPRHIAPAMAAVALALVVALVAGIRVAVVRLQHTSTPQGTPFGKLETLNPAPLSTPSPDVPPTPTPTPYVAPAHLPSTVPAGVPVVYYTSTEKQPDNAVRLEAVDWQGVARGHIDVTGMTLPTPDAVLAILQSPDGERLLVGDSVYSDDGSRLFSTGAAGESRIWADDSRSVCTLTPVIDQAAGTAQWVVTVATAHGVARHAMHLAPTFVGNSGYTLDACSPSRNRAVLYGHVDASTPEVLVARLDTGTPVLDQSLCDEPVRCVTTPARTVTAADGRHSAESTYDGRVQVRNLLTGRTTAVAVHGDVLGMSADGSSVLLSPTSVNPDPDRVGLVDVASGRVLWSEAHAFVAARDAAALPGSTAMAVTWRSAPAPTPDATGELPPPPPGILALLVPSGSGVRVVTVAAGVATMWARSG